MDGLYKQEEEVMVVCEGEGFLTPTVTIPLTPLPVPRKREEDGRFETDREGRPRQRAYTDQTR